MKIHRSENLVKFGIVALIILAQQSLFAQAATQHFNPEVSSTNAKSFRIGTSYYTSDIESYAAVGLKYNGYFLEFGPTLLSTVTSSDKGIIKLNGALGFYNVAGYLETGWSIYYNNMLFHDENSALKDAYEFGLRYTIGYRLSDAVSLVSRISILHVSHKTYTSQFISLNEDHFRLLSPVQIGLQYFF